MGDTSNHFGIFRPPWTGRKRGILTAVGLIWIGAATNGVMQHYFIGGLLGMLGGVVLYLAEVSEDTSGAIKELQSNTGTLLQNSLGRIEYLEGDENVFTRAQEILAEAASDGAWSRVFIYSPWGLWDRSDDKDLWLKALGLALKQPPFAVRSFKGVFVLPPTLALFDDHAVRRLENFKGRTQGTTCQLQYLPPEDNSHPLSAPGTGMIIFYRESQSPGGIGQYAVLYGFVQGDENVLGTGFIVRHQHAGQMVATWLQEQLLDGRARPYTLQGKRMGSSEWIALDESIAEIRERYRTGLWAP